MFLLTQINTEDTRQRSSMTLVFHTKLIAAALPPSLYPGQYPARHNFLNTISIILLWLFFVIPLY